MRTQTEEKGQGAESRSAPLLDEPEEPLGQTWAHRTFQVVAILFAIYLVWSAWRLPLPALQHRAILATFAWVLGLLWFAAKSTRWRRYLFTGLAGPALGVGIYAFISFETLAERVGLPATSADMALMVVAVTTTLLVAWVAIGPVFPCLVIVAILYALYGGYMPGILRHGGFDINEFTNAFFLSSHGVFGAFTGIANFIALFVLFSAFMRALGATAWFSEMASLLVGRFRGGPAKVAVVASTAMGAITGASTANVAATGSVTIPLMKRNGYTAVNAGAIEATSGVGSQIMPPVMGATVFIMMELTGIPYLEIAAASVIIAGLFYLSVFLTVDLQAVRMGYTGTRESQRATRPSFVVFIGQLLLYSGPVVVLLWSIGPAGRSPSRAALNAIIVCAVLLVIRKLRRPSRAAVKAVVGEIFACVVRGIGMAVSVLALVVAASLIAGILTVTGLGVRMSSTLLDIADGRLFVALMLAALVSIILGCGAPTLVAYSLVALLVAPAVADMGVPLLAAHLFVFYYAILGLLTPPVAPDPFIAAGISRASGLRTAVKAVQIALPLFVLPFAIIYQPALLLDGTPVQIVLAAGSAALGVYGVAVATESVTAVGGRKMSWPARLLALASAGVLFVSTSLLWVGLGLLCLVVVHLPVRVFGSSIGKVKTADVGQG